MLPPIPEPNFLSAQPNSINEMEAMAECPVCLERRGHGRSTALPCGHVTCKGCVEILTDRSCPICRAEFDPKKVLDIYL